MRKILFFLIIIFLVEQNVFSQNKILNLEESIKIALNKNLQIKNAKEKLKEAAAKIKEAKSARYFTLSFDSTWTRLNEASYIDMSNFPTSPFTFYNQTGTVNLPVGPGGAPVPVPITSLQIPGMQIQTSSDYLISLATKLGQTLDAQSKGILQQMLANNYVLSSTSGGGKIYMTDEDIYTAKLSFKQPVYTFGRIEKGIKLATLNESVNKYEYLKTEQEVIFNVKKAYFGILQAKHFVEVANQALTSVEDHLKVVKNLYNEGLVAKYDLLRAEVAHSEAKQLLITAKNSLSLAKAGFVTVLGEDFNPEEVDVEEIEVEEDDIQNLKLEDLIEEGYRNRPEILQLSTSIKMAEEAIKLARTNTRPILALVGNYDYKKGDRTPIDWYDTWNITLALSFPFFDSGSTLAKVKQAKHQLNFTKNGLELLKQGIALEVRSAYFDLISAKEKIETARKNIETAEESLKIANERYKNGIGTQVEVTDARTSLTQARTSYYNAIYEYQISFAKLEKATGKIFKGGK